MAARFFRKPHHGSRCWRKRFTEPYGTALFSLDVTTSFRLTYHGDMKVDIRVWRRVVKRAENTYTLQSNVKTASHPGT